MNTSRGHVRHVWRLLLVLVVVFGLALLARHSLVPPTFGAQGHFRGAAPAEIAALPLRYRGNDSCAECHEHEALIKMANAGAHKNLLCENCHGPSRGHGVKGKGQLKLVVDRSPGACLRCHARVTGRPDVLKLIQEKQHASDWDFTLGTPCAECHDVHSPTDSPPVKE